MARMTAFEEKTVELNNGETYFYRKRKGGIHKLLLLHGNMNSSVNWDVLMNELATDFTVYAVDLRGFGESSYNTPIDSLEDFSKDLKAFADAMDFKKELHVAGWSLGGNIAMQFALDYPDLVEKLVLMSSGPVHGYPMEERKFFGLKKTGNYLNTKEDIADGVKMLENIRKKNKRKTLRLVLNKSLYTHKKPLDGRMVKYEKAFMQQRNLVDVNYALSHFNISHEHNGVTEGSGAVDKLNLPVLILHGKGDKVVPVEYAEKNQEAIGDNARIQLFDDAGHALIVDKLSDVAKAYQDFLLEEG